MGKKNAMDYLQELEQEGILLGLERIQQFLELLGNPQDSFKSVHIAGTNGKGSTAAFLESILRNAGIKTGLYTSPHLVEFNERIQASGRKIPDADLARLVKGLRRVKEKAGIKLTYFEFITALAFRHFADSGVEVAVVEVGMGGRLDATNVLKPVVCGVTNVSLEHEAYLGNLIEKIAFEKAGIVKKGVPVFSTARNPAVVRVLEKACNEKGAALVSVNVPYAGKISLDGGFQKWNASLAYTIARQLQVHGIAINDEAIFSGLEQAKWPGRFELSGRLLFDCAHNPAGAGALQQALHNSFPNKKFTFVFGAASDKDVGQMLGALAPCVKEIVATSAKVRGMGVKKICAAAKALELDCKQVPDVESAIKHALNASNGETVVVCGSCFLVGEAKATLE